MQSHGIMRTDAAPLRSYAWGERTGGALTPAQRLRLWPVVLRSYASQGWGLLTWPIRRSPKGDASWIPGRPDSRLARLAEEAAMEQPRAIVEHGFRTWRFGAWLAARDRAELDPELFFVASLLHDTGLLTEVAGEDFTLRSARAAMEVCARAGDEAAASGPRLADAIVAHTTPGLRVGDDPLAYYLQVGAMADLTGMRAWHIGATQLREAYAEHPACEVHRVVADAMRREARAVPEGRFAFLSKVGMPLAVRTSPTRRYART